MRINKLVKRLGDLDACHKAVAFVAEQPTPQEAWDNCERGDWMLWYIGKLAGSPSTESRKKLVLCACECARLALKHVPVGEEHPRIALETAEAWARGNASLKEVQAAAKAAWAAAGAAGAAWAAAEAAALAAAKAAWAAETAAETVSFVAETAAWAAAKAAKAAETSAWVARFTTLNACADIVRKHYPTIEELK